MKLQRVKCLGNYSSFNYKRWTTRLSKYHQHSRGEVGCQLHLDQSSIECPGKQWAQNPNAVPVSLQAIAPVDVSDASDGSWTA